MYFLKFEFSRVFLMNVNVVLCIWLNIGMLFGHVKRWWMFSVGAPHLVQDGSSQGRFSFVCSVLVRILSWKVWKGIESGDCLFDRKDDAMLSEISLLMSGY